MRLRDVVDLGTSHSWSLQRATADDGREVFVKAADGASGVLAAEAAGLRWLAEAGPDAPVVEVLEAGERRLVLPWLEPGVPTARTAERFGRELAAMHAASPGAYGAPWEGYIADLPLDNTLDEGPWPRWYAERRLAPFLRRAAGDLGADGVRLVERVIEEIDVLAGAAEPPARIHGDLWSGNLRWTPDRAVLIDPAAHGGHRESDLAMLALFGAPEMDRIVAAYDEAAPLAPGWRDRVPLHQLHPLLVHVALYGVSYRIATIEAAVGALG
ncbi:fructosamine kinase family protein [Actinomadura macrotermitis]|uniref:Fructosamine-3-kinase n=1 Tax=Actinomadura macrotermitis TaxID=2585200 RepID=A0A7K0BXI6_9ACTN|nr:fructosamine kinase family protein [Actinomadura macrotermitis]MQY05900.1 hypothetical protein [Actinomadura macrotermitis]